MGGGAGKGESHNGQQRGYGQRPGQKGGPLSEPLGGIGLLLSPLPFGLGQFLGRLQFSLAAGLLCK